MNTLQRLFLEINRERIALIAMDADGARQRLLTSRVEAIEAAMTLAEAVAEYVEARDGYEAATRPASGHALPIVLNHADPRILRWRNARERLTAPKPQASAIEGRPDA